MNQENQKLNIGVAELHKVKLTELERARVLENILNTPVPQPSPYLFSSFFVFTRSHRMFSYVGAMCLIILISGAGVTSASRGSLPGDILYPVKVSMLEPLSQALTFSLTDQASYESILATRRMVEAEDLAKHGELDNSRESTLSTLLDSHTDALSHALGQLKEKNPGNAKVENDSQNIANDFESSMNSHAEALDSILNPGHGAGNDNATDNSKGQNLSSHARDNGIKIKNFSNSDNGHNAGGNK